MEKQVGRGHHVAEPGFAEFRHPEHLVGGTVRRSAGRANRRIDLLELKQSVLPLAKRHVPEESAALLRLLAALCAHGLFERLLHGGKGALPFRLGLDVGEERNRPRAQRREDGGELGRIVSAGDQDKHHVGEVEVAVRGNSPRRVRQCGGRVAEASARPGNPAVVPRMKEHVQRPEVERLAPPGDKRAFAVHRDSPMPCKRNADVAHGSQVALRIVGISARLRLHRAEQLHGSGLRRIRRFRRDSGKRGKETDGDESERRPGAGGF